MLLFIPTMILQHVCPVSIDQAYRGRIIRIILILDSSNNSHNMILKLPFQLRVMQLRQLTVGGARKCLQNAPLSVLVHGLGHVTTRHRRGMGRIVLQMMWENHPAPTYVQIIRDHVTVCFDQTVLYFAF